MTLSHPAIQIFLQLRSPLTHVFDLQKMLPLATTRGRHGITEPNRDELHETRIIAMRQVTALVPAEEAKRLLLLGQRTKRFVLRVNQLAQILTFGSRMHEYRSAEHRLGALMRFS